MPVPSGSSTLPSFATPTDLTFRIRRDVDTDAAQANLDDASAEIRAVTHQDISFVAQDTQTLRVRPNASQLVLPQRPASNITAVSITGFTVTSFYFNGIDTISLVPMAGFNQYGYGFGFDGGYSGLPLGPTSYYPTPPTAVVTYDHGSNDADWLSLAKSVCLSVAVRMYDNPTGDKQEAIDDYSRTRADSGGYGLLTQGEIARLNAFYGRTFSSTALSSS